MTGPTVPKATPARTAISLGCDQQGRLVVSLSFRLDERRSLKSIYGFDFDEEAVLVTIPNQLKNGIDPAILTNRSRMYLGSESSGSFKSLCGLTTAAENR